MRLVFLKQRYHAHSGKGRISEATRAKVYAYLGRTRTEPAAPQGSEKCAPTTLP